MNYRKLFTKIHLLLSIPVGLIITLICFSGAMMIFENEVTEKLQPEYFKVEYKAGEVAMMPSELVESVKSQISDTLVISSVKLSADPTDAAIISFANAGRKTLSVNQYTGEVNCWKKDYKFFKTMFFMHRWLMDMPKDKGSMTTGKLIVGVSTVAFVFILLTGLVIWFPARLTRKSIKNRLTISTRKGSFRFLYDFHVAAGFYATLLLLVMALTGLTWSFGWYRNIAYSLFSQEKAMAKSQKKDENIKPLDRKKDKEVNTKSWNKALEEINAKYSNGYKSVKLSAGQAQVETIGWNYIPENDMIKFDREGNIKKIETYKESSEMMKLRVIFYYIHTGAWGGLFTKILYFLAVMIGTTLPLTGYYIWIKKKLRKKSHK